METKKDERTVAEAGGPKVSQGAMEMRKSSKDPALGGG